MVRVRNPNSGADIAIDQGKITGVGPVHEDGDVTLDATVRCDPGVR